MSRGTANGVARALRAASVLALVQYAIHAFLFLSAKPAGPEQEAAASAMHAHRFVAHGFVRSYWEFYRGYGLLVILGGLLEATVLWSLASLAVAGDRRMRPVLAAFLAANVAHALLAWMYFFATPILFDAAVAACLAWALAATRAPQLVAIVPDGLQTASRRSS